MHMIDNDDQYSNARSKAISFIGISHKSSGRVHDYLKRSGVDESVVDQVVDTLIADGYIDDLRVARSIVALRQGKRSESSSRLCQRLMAYGISEQAVNELSEEIPEDSVTIEHLIHAKYGDMDFSSLDSEEERHWKSSALRFLNSRGFSGNLSVSAIYKMMSGND